MSSFQWASPLLSDSPSRYSRLYSASDEFSLCVASTGKVKVVCFVWNARRIVCFVEILLRATAAILIMRNQHLHSRFSSVFLEYAHKSAYWLCNASCLWSNYRICRLSSYVNQVMHAMFCLSTTLLDQSTFQFLFLSCYKLNNSWSKLVFPVKTW